jgi:hypothetical protein
MAKAAIEYSEMVMCSGSNVRARAASLNKQLTAVITQLGDSEPQRASTIAPLNGLKS